jgi:hypothetical protein
MRTLSAVLIALALALGARAASLDYTVTGTYGDLISGTTVDNNIVAAGSSFQFSFTLPTNPTPDSVHLYDPDSVPYPYFELDGITLSYWLDGSLVTDVTAGDITFYTNTTNGPGLLEIYFTDGSVTGDLMLSGPQLFTGSLNSPILVPGSFDAVAGAMLVVNGEAEHGDWGVNITDEQKANVDAGEVVPEPATWFLMIGAALLLVPRLMKLRRSS